jgi:Flp pilus assembly protein CpaB
MTLFLFLLVALLVGGVGTVGTLHAVGEIDLPFLRRAKGDPNAGKVAIPVSAVDVPAYTAISRDHLWDGNTGGLRMMYVEPDQVKPEMILDVSKIIGRVVAREKLAGYAFQEKEFLPPGTRPGLVAGIPPGKRSMTLEVNKMKGIQSLKMGDRFDLVATLPVDEKGASRFESVQMVTTAQQVTGQKRATVRVLAINGVVVSPVTVRLVPYASDSLLGGASMKTRPVQEVVLALEPVEVAAVTEAMATGHEIMCVARSGHPDDHKIKTVLPDVPHPEMQVIEVIQGGRRVLKTFPKISVPLAAPAPQAVVPASGTEASKSR